MALQSMARAQSTEASIHERRHDLDWLRILAFGLLILYHIGMFYVEWSWHVKSSRASTAIQPLMLLSNPWRLTLLFFISGAATRFLSDQRRTHEFIRSRLQRLVPPLILAVLLIVPPQSYYEVIEAAEGIRTATGTAPSSWLDHFYLKYLTANGHWCDHEGCLITPTYNHMWFVAYLIIYTLALAVLLPLQQRMQALAIWLTTGPRLILVPWVLMFALRATLFPVFGETRYFFNDWYLHALYFSTFLFGFALAKHEPFFERCVALRRIALSVALGAWLVFVLYIDRGLAGSDPPLWMRTLFRGVHELQAWTAIIAAIGFAHHHLRAVDGPMRRLLTQAIFPFYLIHQTIIVVIAHHLDKLQLPIVIEVATLIGATVLGCWLFFDLGRRIPVLRPWIGLPRANAKPSKAP